MKVLFVEAFSHTMRAYQRLAGLMLPKEALLRVMQRHERAMRQYVTVDREEMKTLPAIRLSTVLADVQAAGRTVLEKWASV